MLHLRGTVVVLFSFFALCVTARCVAVEGGPNWLVSPDLLEHANLKILWQNELPIKKGESLERIIIVDNCIYVLSDHNYMVSLNREKGNVIFSRPIAPTGIPVVGLELYHDRLISVIGNKLVDIEPETGMESKVKNLEFGVVCPAARNSSYFYLSGPDKRLHTLQADNKIQVFEVAAENDSMITSVIADEWFVFFGTDAGNVISIMPNRPKRLWQFDAGDAIAGPIVRDGRQLFFASKDTNVYRLDIVDLMRTELVWKYQLPAVPTSAPRVTRRVVYQYAPTKGLTAIDKQKGEFMWSLHQGVELLAESEDRAYVITNAGTLVAMDNTTGKKLYSVNFAAVSRYAANTIDSKIYIADERGRVACLQSIE